MTISPNAGRATCGFNLDDNPEGAPCAFVVDVVPAKKGDRESYRHRGRLPGARFIQRGDPVSRRQGPGAASGVILASPSEGGVHVDVVNDWEIVTPTGSGSAVLEILDNTTSGVPDHTTNGLCLGLASGSAASAYARLVTTARAGDTWVVKGWVMNAITSTTGASLRVYDRRQDKYLGADGAWHTSSQDLVADLTSDHAWLGIGGGSGVSFTIPTEAQMGAATTTLELRLIVRDNSGFALFDDLELYSTGAADLMMVAGGHNLTAADAPTWEKSDDGSSWTTVSALEVQPHAFWKLLDAPVTARFHRLRLGGTPPVQRYIGDLILSLTRTMPRTPMTNVRVTYAETGQSRLETPAGTEHVMNRGPYPPRTLDLSYRLPTEAQEVAARAILIDSLRGGAVPCVFWPSTRHFPRLAVFGRIGQPITFDMALQGMPLAGADDPRALEHYSDMSLTVREGPGFELSE